MVPPTPARPPQQQRERERQQPSESAGVIRGAQAAGRSQSPHAHQPSPIAGAQPFQTPDCTTRTLAFDSVASSAAEDATLRARKRRRRVAEAAAFITTRHGARPEESALHDEQGELEELMPAFPPRTPAASTDHRRNAKPRPTAEGWAEDEADGSRRKSTDKAVGSVRSASLSFEDGGGEWKRGIVGARTPGPKRKSSGRMSTESCASQGGQVDAVVEKLRTLVRSCSARHHAISALFYADKLVTMSPSDPNDVLLFADACYLNREFHRAIHAIKQSRLVEVDNNTHSAFPPSYVTLRACLLLGQCMLAIKQKDECLELLGKVLPEREHDVVAFAKKAQLAAQEPEDDVQGVNVVASLALLMGEAFEAMGNRENATLYFRIALRCDVHCAEAFFHLFDKQMLSTQEEKELVASLDFSEDEMQLLELLYQTHVGKYDTVPTVEEKFEVVEQDFGLAGNLELSITKAETYYYQHDIQRAHEICESVRQRDPFNFRMIAVFVATLVELGKKRELYHYAHELVDVYPKKAAAWYTVGCYYLLIQKYEAAQRYFHKSTTLEPSYAPAWIGFGNSFAAQDESDQAMSSYRTASSLFPGSHLPPLYIGMEHLRTNNLVQAHEFIKQASVICPTDPLVYNELGTVYYKQKNYPRAIEMFTKALKLCENLPERLMESWEPTLFNLGYAYRKLRKFDQAIYYFQSALRLSPRNASILAALGFTYHMKGSLDEAIESYHAALAYAPEDTLAGSMITVAFEESLSAGPASFANFTESERDTPKRSAFTPMNAALTSRRARSGSTQRSTSLDQSYSSIEPSRQSLACSSLDFSDDSSMTVDD